MRQTDVSSISTSHHCAHFTALMLVLMLMLMLTLILLLLLMLVLMLLLILLLMLMLVPLLMLLIHANFNANANANGNGMANDYAMSHTNMAYDDVFVPSCRGVCRLFVGDLCCIYFVGGYLKRLRTR